jgi:hypothetical protein
MQALVLSGVIPRSFITEQELSIEKQKLLDQLLNKRKQEQQAEQFNKKENRQSRDL